MKKSNFTWPTIVRENSSLLNGNNLEALYEKIPASERNYLTDAIITLKVNPIDRLHNYVPEGMYYNIQGVTYIELPKNIEFILDLAFANCRDLEYISLPPNIRGIGYRAFYRCIKLHHIVYEGTMDQWNEIVAGFTPAWNDSSNIRDIRCSDGTIEV